MTFEKLLLTIILWSKCYFVHSQWCDNGQLAQPYAMYGYTSNGNQHYENDVYFQSAYPWSYSQPVMYDYTQMYNPYQSIPQQIVVILAEDDLDLVDLFGIPTILDERCNTSPICIPYPGSVPCDCGCDFEKKSYGCKSKGCSCKNKECCPCCDCMACENCRSDCGCGKKKNCGKKCKCSDRCGCCDCRPCECCNCSDRGCKHKKAW